MGIAYAQPSPKRLNLAGQVFGRWEALEFHHSDGNHSYWLARCQRCGVERVLVNPALKKGIGRCDCPPVPRKKREVVEEVTFDFTALCQQWPLSQMEAREMHTFQFRGC